jgi:hypothetical protein
VDVPANKRTIANGKTAIKESAKAISKRLGDSDKQALKRIVGGFSRQNFTSMPEYALNLASVKIAIARYDQGKTETRARRKVRVKTHCKLTQYIEIRDTAGVVVFGKRYNLVPLRNKNGQALDKLRTGKHVKNLAKKYGVTLTRHHIIPNGTYQGELFTIKVS